LPPVEAKPGLQLSHLASSSAPTRAVEVPAGQDSAAVAPTTATYLPEGAGMQVELLLLGW
jgi:hypothetical protein